MEELRDLRRRIRSVRSTQQITRAMSLVASTRLRRIERFVEPARTYAETLRRIVLDIAARTPPWAHPLLKPKEAVTRAYLVITSDRGLAGGYNAEILRRATDLLGAANLIPGHVVVVAGRKGRDFFRRRGPRPVREYVHLPDTPDEALARHISEGLLADYFEGRIDSVHMVFARFVSRGSYQPDVVQLLPVEGAQHAGYQDQTRIPVTHNEGDRNEVIGRNNGTRDRERPNGPHLPFTYEPSPESVLDRLFPHYLVSAVYAALVEAKASELAARTIAMDSATDNAGELIERLTLTYNRARQAEITQEISEIATGAESLR
ncbi:MAG: F-type H+-transporting ATPase subunit gamma [Bacillota bacterium]|nr:ATP synthase F1 subunit gamma [Bacillota bacterium]MDK2931666.1 F-type H+-transporting ATPase subunit gamma [Bacillota bacterium]